jgi:hypothetical protein
LKLGLVFFITAAVLGPPFAKGADPDSLIQITSCVGSAIKADEIISELQRVRENLNAELVRFRQTDLFTDGDIKEIQAQEVLGDFGRDTAIAVYRSHFYSVVASVDKKLSVTILKDRFGSLGSELPDSDAVVESTEKTLAPWISKISAPPRVSAKDVKALIEALVENTDFRDMTHENLTELLILKTLPKVRDQLEMRLTYLNDSKIKLESAILKNDPEAISHAIKTINTTCVNDVLEGINANDDPAQYAKAVLAEVLRNIPLAKNAQSEVLATLRRLTDEYTPRLGTASTNQGQPIANKLSPSQHNVPTCCGDLCRGCSYQRNKLAKRPNSSQIPPTPTLPLYEAIRDLLPYIPEDALQLQTSPKTYQKAIDEIK